MMGTLVRGQVANYLKNLTAEQVRSDWPGHAVMMSDEALDAAMVALAAEQRRRQMEAKGVRIPGRER